MIRPTAILLSYVFLAVSCTQGGAAQQAEFWPGQTLSVAAVHSLAITLSEGRGYTGTTPNDVVVGADLSETEARALLNRAQDWDQPVQLASEFNFASESLPAPRVGETIESVFPAATESDLEPPEVSAGALEVLSYQPQGEIDTAGFVAVTFNQPMVALATHASLDQKDVPVKISPAIDGRWRWIGAKTLRFEAKADAIDRLPKASEFTVTVEAGTTSANGSSLAEEHNWTFTTAAANVVEFGPQQDSLFRTDQVFVAVFNQKVESAEVLPTISLSAAGTERELTLASSEDLEADQRAQQLLDQALEGRAVAFRSIDPLPADAAVEVTVGPETPSAEGPVLSTEPQIFSGRTYPPLKVSEHFCGWGGDDCVPGSHFNIRFSTPLDPATFDPATVSVSPEIPGFSAGLNGASLLLRGNVAGRRDYKVKLAEGITDIYGQRLGEETEVEFKVGNAAPRLFGLEREFIIVDPYVDRSLIPLLTINHEEVRVRAWAVEASHYDSFMSYREKVWNDSNAAVPDWQSVMDASIKIDSDKDAISETMIDLSEAMETANGQIVVRVDSLLGHSEDERWMNAPQLGWVQDTNLALDVHLDGDEMLLWVTDLATGNPIPEVKLELSDGNSLITDSNGLASYKLGPGSRIESIAASKGSDRVFAVGHWEPVDGWVESRDYVFDDRGIYKPGETVRIKGWLRTTSSNDRELKIPAGSRGRWHAYDPQGNEIAQGEVQLNALGGFNLDFELPAGVNLGHAFWEAEFGGQDLFLSHEFQIQEFRTPEFSVAARAESAAPYYYAEPATVAVDAAYYSGGPLPDAEVEWGVFARASFYEPPGWDNFVFGIYEPWWWSGPMGYEDAIAVDSLEDSIAPCFGCEPAPETVERYFGRTNASGTHLLQMDFSAPELDQPSTVTAEATVSDLNRQAWTGRTQILVHPARYYGGIRTRCGELDCRFSQIGESLNVEVVVVDVDGAAVANQPVQIEMARETSVWRDGGWVEELTDSQTCSVDSLGVESGVDSAETRLARCEFEPEVAGEYKITTVVTDDSGAKQRSELTHWVLGAGGTAPSRSVDQEQVLLVPDADSYQPGDVAKVMVKAPFAPAWGVAQVLGSDYSFTFEASDGSAVIEVPVDDDSIPNLMLQVDMTGSTERMGDQGEPLDDSLRPSYAVGRVMLPVPPLARALNVEVDPAPAKVSPAGSSELTVTVKDFADKPLEGAEVAIVMADEAVLSLTGYELEDPVENFYRQPFPYGRSDYARSSLLLSAVDSISDVGLNGSDEAGEESFSKSSVQLSGDAMASDDMDVAEVFTESAETGSDGSPIVLRQDFKALAFYSPSELTDTDGTVKVQVDLPDNLTRYRVMAVAVDGADRFGSGEATVTARLPIMVRPSPPRFLNFGDSFEFPLIVQNQTDSEAVVDLALEGANFGLGESGELSDVAAKRVRVAANDRVEVRFEATTESAGVAAYRVVAVADQGSDAAVGSLPVYTPATQEAFASYGTIDGDAVIAQPLELPVDVIDSFGQLEVGTSTTILQSLTDAVIHLEEDLHDMTHAYSSRLLAVAALGDVLEVFDTSDAGRPEKLREAARSDIAKLAAIQKGDGGWAWCGFNLKSSPFTSVAVAHSLVVAQQSGYQVPQETLGSALSYLQGIESRIDPGYDQSARDEIVAYALHVRDLAGEADVAQAEELYRSASDRLPLSALGWLWQIVNDQDMLAEIERRIQNSVTETPSSAVFVEEFSENYNDSKHLVAHSERRTDGILLSALISMSSDSELIPKVVNGLIGSQRRGRWNSAYDNGFILVAMKNYFDAFEAQRPELVTNAWLGDNHLFQHQYQGHSTTRVNSAVPMQVLSSLVDSGDSVVLSNQGVGRLYYRLGLRYAPQDLSLDARDEGFVVDRSYEPVDDDSDVVRNADGSWSVKPGAIVRVRLAVVADAARNRVALIDPLPAGFEALNPELAVTASPIPEQGDDGAEDSDESVDSWWCCWNWYQHENLRDNRAEIYSDYLPGGVYEYTYLARATTLGTFVVPPTRAEEVFAPEVFGRSASTVVKVQS